MAKLSLTLPIQPGETLPSYCSRTAAVNGIKSASEFSSHFGFCFDRLAKGSHADIEVFAELVGKVPDKLLVGQLVQFGKTVEACGEVFSREFINTDRCRICPVCVLNDIGPNYSLHRAYGRTEWMLRFVHTCPDHGIPLIRLAAERRNASDFAKQLRAVVGNLELHASDPPSNFPTRLQDYLINRVRGGKSRGIWLDCFPLQVAGHFTELFGAVIRDGSEAELENYTSDDWIEVADIGFEIVKDGASAVRAALQVFLASKPSARRIRASVFFGRLSAELVERSDQPGYLDLAKFLEDVARSRYPKLVSDFPI